MANRDRNFFIVFEPGCYCSKCGKRVLRDRYNYKKHGESCGGFIEDDNYEPVREQDYGYRLHKEENNLVLSICRPYLRLRTGFKDQFSGGDWNVIFQCVFMANSKVVKINKQEIDISLDTWVTMIRARKLVRIHRGSDLNVIRSVFPIVKDIYNIQMFVHIYRMKGYTYNPAISKSLADKLLEKKDAIMEKEVIFDEAEIHRQFVDGLRYLPLSNTSRKKRFPLKATIYKVGKNTCVLRILLKTSSGTIAFLFSKDYIYMPDMPCPVKIKDIMAMSVWYDELSEKRIRAFAKRYPSYNLEVFMDQVSNANVLLPLLAPNYHALIELAAKAGLVHVASNLSLPQYDLDPCLYSNLKEAFGLPVDCLKKLEADMVEAHIIKAMKEVWHCDPQFLNFDHFNEQMIRFFVDRQNERITGILQMDNVKTLKILRYLYCNPDYNMYRDYLDISGQMGGIYGEGLCPKNLYQAHDRAVALFKEKRDRIMQQNFDKNLNKESYIRLSSDYREADIRFFEKDEFMILIPRECGDLFKESQAMHNCVRTYVSAVATGKTKIVFLRRKENPQASLGTIEVNSYDQVVQAKGWGNRHLGLSEQRFIRKWAKYKNLMITTYDLEESA